MDTVEEKLKTTYKAEVDTTIENEKQDKICNTLTSQLLCAVLVVNSEEVSVWLWGDRNMSRKRLQGWAEMYMMTSVSASMNRQVLLKQAKGEGIWYGSIESWAAEVKKGQIFTIVCNSRMRETTWNYWANGLVQV